MTAPADGDGDDPKVDPAPATTTATAAPGDGTTAAADPAASPASSAPDGAPSPYDLFAQLTESEEGQQILQYATDLVNQGRPASAAPASNGVVAIAAAPDENRVRELTEKANAGDSDAALELFKIGQAQREENTRLEQVATTVQGKALAEFIESQPWVKELPQSERIKIGVAMLKEGPVAGLTALMNAKPGTTSATATTQDQADRAAANAAAGDAARRTTTPDLPGAVNAGGAPPIEMGRAPADVLTDYFSWRDGSPAST